MFINKSWTILIRCLNIFMIKTYVYFKISVFICTMLWVVSSLYMQSQILFVSVENSDERDFVTIFIPWTFHLYIVHAYEITCVHFAKNSLRTYYPKQRYSVRYISFTYTLWKKCWPRASLEISLGYIDFCPHFLFSNYSLYITEFFLYSITTNTENLE